MIRRTRKLETVRARIAELEADLGLVEQSAETKYERECREWYARREAQRRKEESDEARKFAAGTLYFLGFAIWNPLTFAADPHSMSLGTRHHWMLWVTVAWDLPVAIALAIGSISFIGWLVTGRNLLGRWL